MRDSATITFSTRFVLVSALLILSSLSAQQSLFENLYHPYVELALSGEELKPDLVEQEDLENVVDRLLKLGEFGALNHLFAERSEELSPLLRYVRGAVLAESGKSIDAYQILLPLYQELSKTEEDFLSDPAFYQLARKAVGIGFAHVKWRPIIHVPSGLDAFRGPEGEELLPKVATHLSTTIYWSKGRCLEDHPDIGTPSGDRPNLVDWAEKNPDATLLRGIAIKWSKRANADWLHNAAIHFEETDPELALMALSKLAKMEGAERIEVDRVAELSDRLTNPGLDGLDAIIDLAKVLPALAPQVEETFIETKRGNAFLSSGQIRETLEVSDAINLPTLVEVSLDHEDSINYWKRLGFKIPGDSLWIGSDEAFRENGLDACLIGLLRNEEMENWVDEELRSIAHPAWQLAIAHIEKDESSASDLAEQLASGSSLQRYLAATWFEERGNWKRALGLFTGLDEDSEENSILKWTQLVEFCFRNRDEQVCMKTLRTSIKRLQFHIIPEDQEHRLVDLAYKAGLESEIVIDKNRYRGFRGWGHPKPLVGEKQEERTARFARLSTLEWMTTDELLFPYAGSGNRLPVTAGAKRPFDPNTRSETARYAVCGLLNGGRRPDRDVFCDLARRYPRKTTLLARWIDSCALDDSSGPTLARYLEENPGVREGLLKKIDQLPGTKIPFYNSLAKGLHHVRDETLRSQLIDKALKIAREEIEQLSKDPASSAPSFDPFANRQRSRAPSVAMYLKTLLESPEVPASTWINFVLPIKEEDSGLKSGPEENLQRIEKHAQKTQAQKEKSLFLQLQENQMFFLLVRLMLESDRDELTVAKARAHRLSNLGMERPVGDFLKFTSAAESGKQSLRAFTLDLLQESRLPASADTGVFDIRPHESWQEVWNPEAFVVDAFLSAENRNNDFYRNLITNRVEACILSSRSNEAWAMVDSLVPKILADFDVEKRENNTLRLKQLGQDLFPVLVRDPNLFDELSYAFRDNRFDFSHPFYYYGMYRSFHFDDEYPALNFPISSSEIPFVQARLLASRFHQPMESLDTFSLPAIKHDWTIQKSFFGEVAEWFSRHPANTGARPTDEIREEWTQTFGGQLLLAAWDGDYKESWPKIFRENLPALQKLSDEKQVELASLLATGKFEYEGDDVPSWIEKLHLDYWKNPIDNPRWRSISDASPLDEARRLEEISALFLKAEDLDSFRKIYKELAQRSIDSKEHFRPDVLIRPSKDFPTFQQTLLLMSLPEIDYLKEWPTNRLSTAAHRVHGDCVNWARISRNSDDQQSATQSLANFVLEAEKSISAERRMQGYLLLFSKQFQLSLSDMIRSEAEILVNQQSPDAPDWTRDFLLSNEPVEFEVGAFLSKIDDPHLRLELAESLFIRNGDSAETKFQQETLRIAVGAIAEMSRIPNPEKNRVYRGTELSPWPEKFFFELDGGDEIFEGGEELISSLLNSWGRALQDTMKMEDSQSVYLGRNADRLLAAAMRRDREDIINTVLEATTLDRIVHARPLILQLIAKGYGDQVRDKILLNIKARRPARISPKGQYRRFTYGLSLKPAILEFCKSLGNSEIALLTEITLALDSWAFQKNESPFRNSTHAEDEEYLKWLRSLHKRVVEFSFEDPKIQFTCVELLRKCVQLSDKEKGILDDLL